MAALPIAHLAHKEEVRRIDDPETDLGGDHGEGEAEHLLPEVFVEALELDEVPQFARQAEEEDAGQIAADDGQQVAVGPHPKDHQIEHIEHEGGKGAEDAIHGHQLVPLAAADELGAEGAQAAHKDVNIDEQAVLGHIGQKLHGGPEHHQQAKAAQDGEQAVGEDLLFAVALIEAEADDGIGHAHGDEGDEQVCILAQDLGKAEVRDLSHGIGQKRLDDEGQQLRREAGDGKDEGIARQLAVFIAGCFFL